jgi:hypothetical protein
MAARGKRGIEKCWDCRCSLDPNKGYNGSVSLWKIWNKQPQLYCHLPVHDDGSQPVFICESCSEIRENLIKKEREP